MHNAAKDFVVVFDASAVHKPRQCLIFRWICMDLVLQHICGCWMCSSRVDLVVLRRRKL
jgi:hypothetical protein